MKEKQTRARYTLELMLESMGLFNERQPMPLTSKDPESSQATLGHWSRDATKRRLQGAGNKAV